MAALVFGWEEWAALPALGLPAVKAKVDTGARTSVLHAVALEAFGSIERPRVRFTVPPSPGDSEAPAQCEAELADRRRVASSNGGAEIRPIIRTALVVGGAERVVELSLTDRRLMTYRMLLGREALAAFGAVVDPSRTQLQPAPAAAVEGPSRPSAPREDRRVSARGGLG